MAEDDTEVRNLGEDVEFLEIPKKFEQSRWLTMSPESEARYNRVREPDEKEEEEGTLAGKG